MPKNSKIPFAEFLRFLQGLGYKAKRSDKVWVVYRSKDDLLAYRLYGDTDTVTEGDLWYTRRYLDLRGVLAEDDFDAFVREAATPA
ncbi:MAG TPA: hypothetical protein VEL76_18045 [Gemmataceae bacterium]|nr:hypothetical protein [Gemmataceae bacterium]